MTGMPSDCICRPGWSTGREQDPDCPVHGTEAMAQIWNLVAAAPGGVSVVTAALRLTAVITGAVSSAISAALTSPGPVAWPPPGCVICHATGQRLDPGYGGIPVCADVAACVRRKQAQLAADGKLEQDF